VSSTPCHPNAKREGFWVIVRVIVAVLALFRIDALAFAQSSGIATAAEKSKSTLQGFVRDSTGKPVANVAVTLLSDLPALNTQKSVSSYHINYSSSDGAYHFGDLAPGIYTLLAAVEGYDTVASEPVKLTSGETKDLDLVLGVRKAAAGVDSHGTPGNQILSTPEFFDEPQFTVAGVTAGTNAGGHGSDTVLRTTEALAKATTSLSKDAAANYAPGTPSSETSAVREESLRKILANDPKNVEANQEFGTLLVAKGKIVAAVPYLQLASQSRPDDSNLHRLLAEAYEASAQPLDAVREYQRAAELNPSEINLLDWGTELLTHRALEAATEILSRGNRLFPNSVRILVALGVAWYGRGSYAEGTQCLVNASDFDPNNPLPYLFLGKMEAARTISSQAAEERLARFARVQPDNALANYYYAVSLWQHRDAATSPNDAKNKNIFAGELSDRVEALLLKAVRIDPKFGAAYLQLGIFYADRDDFTRAIAAYREAIANAQENDTLTAAHYRLAQAYLRTGEKEKAQEELEVHRDLAKRADEQAVRERNEIQQFVISLHNKPVEPAVKP
jgi:tetratricopeptide (TPR) repeat protein